MADIAENLMRLQEQTNALIAVFDADDRLQFANAAYRDAYVVSEGETPLWSEIMRRNHALGQGAIVNDPNIESWIASAYTRRGKSPKRSFEVDMHDGRWFWVEENVRPDGWMMTISVDVTELRAEERELRQHRDLARKASRTDELTGIANRRHVMNLLNSHLSGESVSGSRSGCVCLFDLDHFKQVNDTYGHQTGDRLLVQFCRTVQGKIRRSDFFGRIGGEEFMLVMPDTTLEQGEMLVDRIMDGVRNSRPLSDMAGFGYTTSAGLAEMGSNDTVETVYSRADAALYCAKNEGRDRMIYLAA